MAPADNHSNGTVLTEINHQELLLRFDDLVTRAVINYAPGKTVHIEQDGLAMRTSKGTETPSRHSHLLIKRQLEFHISPSLLTKPAYEEALVVLKDSKDGISDAVAQKDVVRFGPGSDLANSDPGLLVTTIRNTHLLIISVFRPQLLLLTCDSYRRQHEPLDVDEFAAVCTVLATLASPHFVIYNCSPEAGASREHKHLQILPRPVRLFPDIPDFVTEIIPYRYFLRYLSDIDLKDPSSYTKLFEIYRLLLAEAKEKTPREGFRDNDPNYFSHNVALVAEWIIVIPRRSNNFEGVTANAAGMMGSVWLTHEAQLDRWKDVGPARVLSGLGIPRNGTQSTSTL
jgi:ATP adenylyltransferase